MVRTKIAAVYLGTLGLGLMGTYSSIAGMVVALAGAGIGNSGVRQIAEAVGAGDQAQIARTVLTVRRTALVAGSAGTMLLIALAGPVCEWTFGDRTRTLPLAVLSVTIVLNTVAGGQAALVQGLRRIGDLARMSIIGTLIGTITAIPMMMIWGQGSIIAILVTSSVITTLTSWYYAKRAAIRCPPMPWRKSCAEAVPLLTLGIAFASSGLMSSGAAYLTRAILIRHLDLEATGLYGAAWSLSSFYVGFILGAMGADFYPRLTAVSKDHGQVNRLVNEQTEVALLLALPGLVSTLAFAPWILRALYSPEFLPAGEVLRWQVLGLGLRVVSWPIGFILLATANARMFFVSELAANCVHVSLVWAGVLFWGLTGAGIALLGLYVFHVLLMALLARWLTGFRWSPANRSLIGVTAAISLAVFILAKSLPSPMPELSGAAITAVAGTYSLRALTRLTGANPITAFSRKVRASIAR